MKAIIDSINEIIYTGEDAEDLKQVLLKHPADVTERDEIIYEKQLRTLKWRGELRVEDIKFVVTGLKYGTNKRFKNVYNSYEQALMINLWNGSVWLQFESGKRKLLKRVYN